MQKFKVKKEEIGKAIERLFPQMTFKIKVGPNPFLILEGELLEDGTVEKCPVCKWGCMFSGSGPCQCPCHNKKEEKCAHGVYDTGCAICFEDDGIPIGFNRETTKRDGCYPGHRCEEHKYMEEVKLPERLYAHIGWSLAEYSIKDKINEILAYLASKEKKGGDN